MSTYTTFDGLVGGNALLTPTIVHTLSGTLKVKPVVIGEVSIVCMII